MSNIKQIKEHYFVDKNGNVFSDIVKGSSRNLKIGQLRALKQRFTKKGHAYVDLGRGDRRYVHQLVLELFVSPRPENAIALHRNDIKTDNSVSNLYWGSYTDNHKDSVRNGTFNDIGLFKLGHKSPNAISSKEIGVINKLRKAGMSLNKIAGKVNRSYPTVQKYVAKVTYIMEKEGK